MQVGKHGLIIEFTDPDYNIRRSATYLPEVASHEGECFIFHHLIHEF
jgi:AMMECR1 domain-containing protein